MFEYEQTGGASDSWVSRWREWRGIDKWLPVQAKVLRNELIDTGEGQYHKLELTYMFQSIESNEDALIVIWLTAYPGTKPASAQEGDHVDLLVNPKSPDKATFIDTANSASTFVFVTLFCSVLLFVLLLKSCS